MFHIVFKLAMLGIVIFLSSCASYQPGEYAKVIKGQHPSKFSIATKVDKHYSTDEFLFINLSFGNFTKDWVRVKKVDLHVPKHLQDKVHIIVGEDLVTWSKSMEHKLAIDNYNRKIIFGSLAVMGTTGALVAAKNNQKGLAAGSLALGTGALLVEDFNTIMGNIADLERAQVLPPEHLYQPFSIPPFLYTNKWILLQIPKNQRPCDIYFDLEYVDHTKASYQVDLRDELSCKKSPE